MKHIKMIAIAIIATTILGYTSLEAAGNFELFNKSNEGVEVEIKSGSNRQTIIVNPGDQKQATVDSNQIVYLKITGRASKKVSKWELDANGKTKYITYNPQKKPAVYPQTGPLMGFMGKTES